METEIAVARAAYDRVVANVVAAFNAVAGGALARADYDAVRARSRARATAAYWDAIK